MQPDQVNPPTQAVDTRHQDSRQRYPDLNLSAGEYVIMAVRRHPINLVFIWSAEIVVIIVVTLLLSLDLIAPSVLVNSLGLSVSFHGLALFSLFIIVLMLAIGTVSTSIYRDNQFYLTNESIIEHARTGLFARREKTISLGSVEDVSFSQRGILQYAFNYGSIRLATVGDETSYRFTNVSNPRLQIAKLTQAVEDFKNGRPVQG
jgi:uncharacterized membrane protein YdbT with pleckstrin-like domain